MKTFKSIIVVAVIGLVAYGAVYAVQNYAPKQNFTIPEQASAHQDEYVGGVEQVMSREDFKKQQALLAKEIYLKEEKLRVQTEYDAKLKKIETDLEAVRAEKVTF
jgi:hypothetical protein